MAGQTCVVGSHPEFPFRACSTGENLTPAAVRPIFSCFHSVCLVPRGALRTVTPYPGDFPAGTSHVSVCLQTLLWCHNCDLMRAIFLTETILVISSSSLLSASTAGMGCGIYTHADTHTLTQTHTHTHSTHTHKHTHTHTARGSGFLDALGPTGAPSVSPPSFPELTAVSQIHA